MNLLQAAAMFGTFAFEVEKNTHDALEGACKIVEKEAKRVLGTYDYNWVPLAPSTVEDRTRKGFAGDEPLLRIGDMRDSIEHTVHGKSGFVGSNDDKAVWQELGTRRIPPRSFLGGAAMRKGEEVAKHIGHETYSLLRGEVNRAGGYNVGGLYVGKW